MRKIQLLSGDMIIKEKVNVVYEKVITPFGNSGKLDAKKYIGKRAYVVIVD